MHASYTYITIKIRVGVEPTLPVLQTGVLTTSPTNQMLGANGRGRS